MAKYILLATLRDTASGAKRGTVAAIRELNQKVTEREELEMNVMETEMTPAEKGEMISATRPRAHHIPGGQPLPGASEEEIETWQKLMRVERKKRRVYGLTVDMNAPEIVAKLADLNDPGKRVKAYPVPKTRFTKKLLKAVEI